MRNPQESNDDDRADAARVLVALVVLALLAWIDGGQETTRAAATPLEAASLAH